MPRLTQTLAWLEQNVLFTRRGRGGVQQVKTRGLVAARVHPPRRPLRRPEPAHPRGGQQQGPGRGRDGGSRWTAGCSTRPTSPSRRPTTPCSRPSWSRRLGVRFTARPTGPRPVGGSVRSARSSASTRRLAAGWSRAPVPSRPAAASWPRTSRPTTVAHRPPVEAIALGKQATSETRQAKHAPRAEADQRLAWRAEAIQILGSQDAVDAMVETAVRTPPR